MQDVVLRGRKMGVVHESAHRKGFGKLVSFGSQGVFFGLQSQSAFYGLEKRRCIQDKIYEVTFCVRQMDERCSR